MAAALATRRLPGISFAAEPPASPRVLPRMDVAAFVGFAAAGPLHVPVAVEDDAGFAAVFGGDAPLAWDAVRGAPEPAQLPVAVRSFFRNGGRRAWIVRVASEASERSAFALPGVLEAAADGTLREARVVARARGSWADDLRVGTALLSAPALLRAGSAALLVFELETGATVLAPGDLLRIVTGPYTLFVVVAAVRPTRVLPPSVSPAVPGRTLVTVLGDPATAVWFERAAPPYGVTGTARYLDRSGREQRVVAGVPFPDDSPPGSPPDGDGELELDLAVEPVDAPEPGTLVEWGDGGPERLWLRVATLGGGESGRVTVGGPAQWALAAAPDPVPRLDPEATTVERLELELRVQDGNGQSALTGLGCAPGHPRYVGDLPTDEQLYTPRDPLLGPQPSLWADAAAPRFPLAGSEHRAVLYPLGAGVLLERFSGPLAAARGKLDRDGLAEFSDALFLDEDLRAEGLRALGATADYIQWQRPTPRPLTGIHALLDVEEATIVAVPDAVQRGWAPAQPIDGPDAPPTNEPAAPPQPPATFADCALHALEPPAFDAPGPRDRTGAFALSWSAVDEPGVRYALQEGTDPRGWDGAETIYTGPARVRVIAGRAAGTFFYRVRAEAGPNVSPWSEGVAVHGPPPTGYTLALERHYEPRALLAVQRALLRMCATRGDMLAVLSVPAHYRERAAIAHAARLRDSADVAAAVPGPDPVLPLDASEQRALSYGALYHPWPIVSLPDGGGPRPTAPDGIAAGVIALRAATRGAWIAPANQTFVDVIALVHPSPREALAGLQDAQVNELRQEPGGFVCLCADTLSADGDVRPINVRRLLSLVRRLALREGTEYVFEPNSPAFRRAVERGFGQLMQTLYMLGAFSGRTPEQAYRVEIGTPPNTAASIDRGRLIVELKLAPSRPLAFLLVRLVHAGERGLTLETP